MFEELLTRAASYFYAKFLGDVVSSAIDKDFESEDISVLTALNRYANSYVGQNELDKCAEKSLAIFYVYGSEKEIEEHYNKDFGTALELFKNDVLHKVCLCAKQAGITMGDIYTTLGIKQ
jgi:hypothetical protein